MADETKIQWCDRTFNPWIGCTKVSSGCKNCYAETLMDKRYGRVKWGPQGTRQRTSESYWKKPLAWNKQNWMECLVCHWRGDVQQVPFVNTEEGGSWTCPNCSADGRMEPARQRVFCASLADVFEDYPQATTDRGYTPGMANDLNRWRTALWKLIDQTPNLDWLLLTKRPENVLEMLPFSWLPSDLGTFPANVWIGTSVENQETADKRIPELIKIPAAVRFLSCEPLLGPVDLRLDDCWIPEDHYDLGERLSWVIVGGESGPKARPMNLQWARGIIDQCQAAGVSVFMKQLGSSPVAGTNRDKPYLWGEHLDKKGGEMDEWPVDLQIREFPVVDFEGLNHDSN